MTFKARVRGIYSTAMTKLLLDNGFEIAQASPTIRERFNLDENMKSPDVDIYDRRNRQGVHATGTDKCLKALKTLLTQNLTDAVFRQQPFPIDGIYKGATKPAEETERFVPVDIGSTVGRLPKNETDANAPSNIVVQIQKKHTSRKPLLSTEINIPGKYAVLLAERKIKVSLRIRDFEKRKSLIELGNKIASSSYGIIWRTAAADQPEKVLESEINHLAKTREEVLKKAEDKKAPALLWGPQYYMNVEFPALSKSSLDKIRSQVAQTIKGHHYYKACGKSVSIGLDMAEKILETTASAEEVQRLFQDTIEANFPIEGTSVSIEHVKPDGNVFHLGKALVEKLAGNGLRYCRVFKNEGVYDNLNTPKEPGDRAVTDAKIGSWHYTTRYFSRNGVYKGAHINLNTPLELYPRWIRYVDLEVDVCALPDGSVRAVDEDELEEAVAEGFISQKLATIVKGKLKEILENFKDNSGSQNC